MPGTTAIGSVADAPGPVPQEGGATPGSDAVTIRDEALMAQFCGGSREAFEALFERYKQPVYGFFRRRVGERASAEELTQETFLGLFRAQSRYEARAQFRTYLYAIATNVLRAHRRKAGVREVFLHVEGEEPVSTSSPYAHVVLRQALSRLNETEREILLLREFEQMSYSDIAELQAIPLNTVRTRLLRARLALRELLTGSDERGVDAAGKERL